MSRTTIPTQLRVNDPYQQRLLQFDTQDSRVYLSRVSNYLLKSFGNDAVIKGLEVININLNNTIVELTVSPGLIIQDSTLIDITTPTVVSFDLNGLDSCSGYLILYTNYQYLNVINSNNFLLKLSYITKDGFDIIPSNDLWNKDRNRVYLGLFRFNNLYELTEIINPNFFYIYGKIFYRRGKLNFLPINDTTSTISPDYYNLIHNFNSYCIFTQLFDDTRVQKYINTFNIPDLNNINISIDEYKNFDDPYYLLLANKNDVEQIEIQKINLVNNEYIFNHNYNQRNVQVQIYNSNKELVHPKFIKLVDNNTLIINFSNLEEDESIKYYINVIKDVHTFNIVAGDFITDHIFIEHNLNKLYLLVQIVNNTTNMMFETPATTLYNNNNIVIDTTLCNIVPDSYTVMLYKNSRLLYNLYNDGTYSLPYNVYIKNFGIEDLVQNSILITHNLETLYPIVQLYDYDKNIILFDEISIENLNTVKLVINNPVYLTYLTTIVVYSFNQTVIPFNITDLDVNYLYRIDNTSTHVSNPIIQLYDQNNELVIPNKITRITEFIFDVGLSNNLTSTDFNLTLTEGFERYNEIFNSSTLIEIDEDLAAKTITHNLETLYPIVQVYDLNDVILPNNIQVLNNNQIKIIFNKNIITQYEVLIITGIKKILLDLSYNNLYIKEINELDLIDSKIIINHNLNFLYPIVQVYDLDNNILSESIQILNNNQIQLDFTSQLLKNFYRKITVIKI